MKWKISYCVVNDFVLISKDQFFKGQVWLIASPFPKMPIFQEPKSWENSNFLSSHLIEQRGLHCAQEAASWPFHKSQPTCCSACNRCSHEGQKSRSAVVFEHYFSGTLALPWNCLLFFSGSESSPIIACPCPCRYLMTISQFNWLMMLWLGWCDSIYWSRYCFWCILPFFDSREWYPWKVRMIMMLNLNKTQCQPCKRLAGPIIPLSWSGKGFHLGCD